MCSVGLSSEIYYLGARDVSSVVVLGVGGKGVLPRRDRDTFGLGYYHLNMADSLPDVLGLAAEQGVELFYNIEIKPWLHLTPDLQVIVDPGAGFGDRDTAIVYGLRLEMNI